MVPAKFIRLPFVRLPPSPRSEAIQVIFRGILIACDKNPTGPIEIRAKESLLSFARISIGPEEKQSFSSKNDAKYSCPPQEKFLRSFFQKATPRARRRKNAPYANPNNIFIDSHKGRSFYFIGAYCTITFCFLMTHWAKMKEMRARERAMIDSTC